MLTNGELELEKIRLQLVNNKLLNADSDEIKKFIFNYLEIEIINNRITKEELHEEGIHFSFAKHNS